MRANLLPCLLLLALARPASAAGKLFEVKYDASTEKDGLQMGVTYTLWVPDGVTRIRAVIVHQHGCGVGACKGGETAAFDLHWQTLAKKHDCALLGPSYHQAEKQNCRLWCDPRNGSDATFRKALADLAKRAKRPEIAEVPWCLWGHSGGGFWASLMQTLHPERIVAIWFRSGTAFTVWEKGDIAKPKLSDAVYTVPMMLNPGAKEKDHKQFAGAWTGSLAMFEAYRAKGAPVGVAPDPRTGHECGDSRYLAIPFFDACLKLRLPEKDAKDQKLRPVDARKGHLTDLLGDKAVPAEKYTGKVEKSVWLPDEHTARAWEEYVKVGSIADKTPPPSPTSLKAERGDDGIVLTWQAEADFESGLSGFVIRRDGKEVARLPQKPVGRFGRALFQSLSYHDTPERPMPAMRYVDKEAKAGAKHEYRVIAVNSVGLESEASQPAAAK